MAEWTACIGVGNVGRSWAMVFARAGYNVSAYDPTPGAFDKAIAAIAEGLTSMEHAGLMDDSTSAIARVRPAATLQEAVSNAVYVQESVPENLAIKQETFRAMDGAAPQEAILASSVSAIPGSHFMEDLVGSHRCVVAHPTNPPHLVPVIEVVPAPSTSEETLERCVTFLESVDRVPVRLNKEIFGYVLNRVQFALIKEALHLVQKDYISATDVDKVIKHGLGRRWAFMGPFETGHLNATEGLRAYFGLYNDTMTSLFEDLFTDMPAIDVDAIAPLAEEIERLTPIEQVPERQAWRDRNLAKLAQELTKLRTEEDT